MSIFPMAVPTPDGEASVKSWWLYLLLGIVLVIAGVCVLGDVVLASVVSAIFIGWAIVIVGFLRSFMRLARGDGRASCSICSLASSTSPVDGCCSPTPLPQPFR